ncbi:MAG: NUDIX hydrolase [Gammaproteobacteria bacterium]|nr:MAG: NUDIX hydrolase [Gammaproteobacteria bacterium]
MSKRPKQGDNPWRTLAVREVYDNPWIRVTAEDVLKPSGEPGIYGKVSFKNIACGIIPLADNHDTWLVGQYRYTLDEYSWEIPMGGVPLNEALLDGAQRELREETGLRAARWALILRSHVSNSISDEVGVVYVAEDLIEGEPEFEDTEQLEICRLPFAEALRMAMRGEITDLLSIAGLLKLAMLRPQLRD